MSGDDRASGDQEFGAFLVSDRGRLGRWYEPAWKMFLSNKLLLVALWRLFPGHDNLLPSFADGPGGMTDFVVKPVFGREGDGIAVHRADGSVTSNGTEYRRAGTGGERVGSSTTSCRTSPAGTGTTTRCSGRGSSTGSRSASASESPTGRSPTTGAGSRRTSSASERRGGTTTGRGAARQGCRVPSPARTAR